MKVEMTDHLYLYPYVINKEDMLLVKISGQSRILT